MRTGVLGAAVWMMAAAASAQNLQGNMAAWRADPALRSFYETVKAACARGCAKADVPALEAASDRIFARMAKSHGMDPRAMQDHMKAMPAQMVRLGAEDPKVVADFDAFTTALMGPK